MTNTADIVHEKKAKVKSKKMKRQPFSTASGVTTFSHGRREKLRQY